jgi:hypothetical protein
VTAESYKRDSLFNRDRFNELRASAGQASPKNKGRTLPDPNRSSLPSYCFGNSYSPSNVTVSVPSALYVALYVPFPLIPFNFPVPPVYDHVP